jgi:taurine dioxygenase
MATAMKQDGELPFTVTRLTGTLGAALDGIALSPDLPQATIDALGAALVEHKVIFFVDQTLSADELLAFGRRFGPLEEHPFVALYLDATRDAPSDLIIVESKGEVRSKADIWHSDVTWRQEPSLGTILRCNIIPSFGGDTLFADMGAAYRGLDAETRSLIDGLTAIHDWDHFRRELLRNNVDPARIAELEERFPPAEHPVVRTHPVSGEKILFVNAGFTVRIKGWPEAESRALLERLYRQAWKPDYQVRYRWKPNAIAFWDNRSTQHYAVNDYGGEHRRMERVTIAGDRPF